METKKGNFCEKCLNRLDLKIDSELLYFRCYSCNINYKANNDDSLIYEEVKGDPLSKFNNVLNKLSEDPLNPKVRVKCPSCGYNIARQVRIGDDMKLVNGCIKCKHQWFY